MNHRLWKCSTRKASCIAGWILLQIPIQWIIQSLLWQSPSTSAGVRCSECLGFLNGHNLHGPLCCTQWAFPSLPKKKKSPEGKSTNETSVVSLLMEQDNSWLLLLVPLCFLFLSLMKQLPACLGDFVGWAVIKTHESPTSINFSQFVANCWESGLLASLSQLSSESLTAGKASTFLQHWVSVIILPFFSHCQCNAWTELYRSAKNRKDLSVCLTFL